ALRAAASREGGIDAVLIALRGNEARLLTPQLFASGLGQKLLVATSQLTSGTGKPDEDRALDGIAFASEPWTTGGIAALPSPQTLAADLPTARGPAARLFAFGYDGWLLSGYLQHLAADPEASVDGATGRLSLDAGGSVLRIPAWATFRNGPVVPLAGPARRPGGARRCSHQRSLAMTCARAVPPSRQPRAATWPRPACVRSRPTPRPGSVNSTW